MKEIKEESFFLLHANMFEYVYDYYVTKPKWLLGRYDKEKWEAGKTYIKCFKTAYNPKTRDYLNDNRDVYTTSFQKFMDAIIGPDQKR